MSSRHPFSKAYLYNSTFISHNGKMIKSTNVLAIKFGSDKTADEIVLGWNNQRRQSKTDYHYELVKELDVNEAIKIKSKNGSTIESSWQFIEHLPYCTLTVSFVELHQLTNTGN